jgi:hypothetical protein
MAQTPTLLFALPRMMMLLLPLAALVHRNSAFGFGPSTRGVARPTRVVPANGASVSIKQRTPSVSVVLPAQFASRADYRRLCETLRKYDVTAVPADLRKLGMLFHV